MSQNIKFYDQLITQLNWLTQHTSTKGIAKQSASLSFDWNSKMTLISLLQLPQGVSNWGTTILDDKLWAFNSYIQCPIMPLVHREGNPRGLFVCNSYIQYAIMPLVHTKVDAQGLFLCNNMCVINSCFQWAITHRGRNAQGLFLVHFPSIQIVAAYQMIAPPAAEKVQEICEWYHPNSLKWHQIKICKNCTELKKYHYSHSENNIHISVYEMINL